MKRAPILLVLLPALALPLAAGCEEVPLPYQLDHSRVMAVRVDPPAIAAGERARVEVLVTDAIAGPRVADPGAVSIAAPAGLALARDAAGWAIDAPGERELAVARAALGLAPDADVIVPLAITIATETGELTAQKTLALGARAANPAAPTILQDGAPAPGPMASGREVQLAVTPMDRAYAYRWFSSVGELTGYTRAEARLDPEGAARGLIGVVARDQAGGTAWTLVEVEVSAP
jgi:hypothetical protein